MYIHSTEHEAKRLTKALNIIHQKENVVKLNANTYNVRSQSVRNRFYLVEIVDDIFQCNCMDFLYRYDELPNHECKHIISVKTILETENHFPNPNIKPVTLQERVCKACGSQVIIKDGLRPLKSGIKKQKFRCKDCGYKFALTDEGFERMMYDPKIVTEALNLIMSGLSLRKTASHLKITYNRTISHVALMLWVRKFTKIMKAYTDTLAPKVSDIWHADEMMLNVKGEKPNGKGRHMWQWNLLDHETKFWIATQISKKREIADARRLFREGKNIAKSIPKEVITDSLPSYSQAILREFPRKDILSLPTTKHTKYPSIVHSTNNNRIERLHNEIREKTRTMRGLGNENSAQVFSDASRIYHNFVRPHSSLENKTPAEVAGLDLELGNNKLHNLIKQSGKKFNEEHKFKLNLGKRLYHVDIIDEENSIKVKTKRWLDKQIWREINDILSLHGFSWQSNGKDSCWLKPTHDHGLISEM